MNPSMIVPTFVRWLVCCLLANWCLVAVAQTPAPLPMPNVPLEANGTVYAIVKQAGGAVVFAGDFTEVNGTPHHNLARILPDGTLDAAWTPSTNGPVFSLALGTDGSIYAGGLFTDASGQSCFSLAKFAGSGGGAVDVSWVPFVPGQVKALATGSDGSVFLGGNFHSVNNESVNNLAKVSGSGTLDPTWRPSPNGSVQALVFDGTSLYVGGVFTFIGGQSRNRLARLSQNGTGSADAWDPSANSAVVSLALEGTTGVYTGGFFTSIGGQARSHIAKLGTSGTGLADATWDPSPDEVPNAIALTSDGSVIVGGFFSTIGGAARARIAKLSATGSGAADLAWNPSANARLWALASDAQGRVYAGGAFSSAAGATHRGFAVIDSAGTSKTPFDATEPGWSFAMARQPDGSIIAGGYFFEAGGLPRDNILRLHADGSLDTAWNPSITAMSDASAIRILALAADADGAVYAGGYFEQVNDEPRTGLVKLSGSGTGAVDTAWKADLDNSAYTLTLDGNGSLYVGGSFASIGGIALDYLARVSATGTAVVDAAWAPSPDYYVYTVALDTDGSVYAGGDFSSIGGESRNYVAKLSPAASGDADPAWDAGSDGTVFSLVLDHNGQVYAGGWFFNIGGQERRGLARLASTGTGAADANWNPSTSPIGASIYAMALDGIGSIYVGGSFIQMGSVNALSIAKVSTAGTGIADPSWNPGVNDGTNGTEGLQNMVVGDGGKLFVGGGFTEIGGETRNGVAALPIVSDVIFADGFEAHAQQARGEKLLREWRRRMRAPSCVHGSCDATGEPLH